jgi:hypothetical protein
VAAIVKIGEIEIFEDDFQTALDEARAALGVDDLRKEGQRIWKAALRMVGKRVFPDNSILKERYNNTIRYNYKVLNILCDYYLFISDYYYKLPSTVAFSYFINARTETIDDWKDEEPSSPYRSIWKKLQSNRLDCIKDKTYDNGNVTGSIAVGNWDFQLNMPGVREQSKRQALSASELPKLCGNMSLFHDEMRARGNENCLQIVDNLETP